MLVCEVQGCDFRRVCQLESCPKMWQKTLLPHARSQEHGAHREPGTVQEWEIKSSDEIHLN